MFFIDFATVFIDVSMPFIDFAMVFTDVVKICQVLAGEMPVQDNETFSWDCVFSPLPLRNKHLYLNVLYVV